MRQKFLSFAIAIISLCTMRPNADAQVTGLNHINQQLRSMFTGLDRPSSGYEFLYDMTAHVSDSAFFASNCLDTLESPMFYRIYEEMYQAAYDTARHIVPKHLYFKGNQFRPDTIPMGIMHYGFYKLKPDALTSGTYFEFDTMNNSLKDKYPRPSSPYEEHTLFSACPLLTNSHFVNPLFRVDPAFILYDEAHNYYDGKFQNSLRINFGDGSGWVTFDPSKITHHEVKYSSAGQKYIETAIFDHNNNMLAYSLSTIIVIMDTYSVTPDEMIDVPGLEVGLYMGCLRKGNPRLVIYLSGIDLLDFLPSQNRTIQDIYTAMIKQDQIVQLKNQGFDFVVVDWKNSRIDIRHNALYLVNLIEYLKCYTGGAEQFVIMGESMGGLVARYALTYMESKEYQQGSLAPFFNHSNYANAIDNLNMELFLANWKFGSGGNCMPEKMHNTRLLITLDTPHQGANIPMGIQQLYHQALTLLGSTFGFDSQAFTEGFNLFLDGIAAKQMLIYHVGTKDNFSYKDHEYKTSFFDDLKKLGNYPNFAKVVAMSNGSLSGVPQTNYYSMSPRIAGDRLLDLDMQTYARILWFKVPVAHIDFECNTNHNGVGQVLNFELGTKYYTLKLFWFGVRLQEKSLPIFKISERANIKPYCVNAGGYEGKHDLVSRTPDESSFSVSSNYWILNFFSYKYTVDQGCLAFKTHAGLNGFASTHLDLSICSDGAHFGFVPVQSALDYGKLATNNIVEDIENENIHSKLNKVNASVIIGYPGKTTGINHRHLGFRNDYIYNLTQKSTSHSSTSEYTYYACLNISDDVERGLLNLEIGDEELYLENVTLNWDATYQTEFDIHVNERNPYYAYPSSQISPLIKPGLYSKDKSYKIKNGTAEFVIDTRNSPTGIGLNYSTPVSKSHIVTERTRSICCVDYTEQRQAEPRSFSVKNESGYLWVFPNPNSGTSMQVQFKLKNSDAAKLEIIDAMGQRLYSDPVPSFSENEEILATIDIAALGLPSGFYIIQISNKSEQYFSKTIIQK